MLSQPRNSRESRNPVTPGLDQIPVAAVGFDANLNCSLVSAAARALIPFAEPEGLSAAVLFSDWFSPPVIGQACPSVGTARHADGRVFRCELSDTGQGGYWLVLTDISVHVLEAGRVAQDSLTGLMQRGALNAQLTDLLAAADRDGMGAAIHCVDLDRFKAVNDTLGHPDRAILLLRLVSRTLRDVRSVILDRPDASAATNSRSYCLRLRTRRNCRSWRKGIIDSLSAPLHDQRHRGDDRRVDRDCHFGLRRPHFGRSYAGRRPRALRRQGGREGLSPFFDAGDARSGARAAADGVWTSASALEKGQLRLVYQPWSMLRVRQSPASRR